MKVAALIPARSGSERVKDKNMKMLGAYPLLARKINQLLKSKVDEVFLGSDNQYYLEVAEQHGAVPVLRSDISCDEGVSSANDMISDFVARIPDDFDIIIWAHCTNPFLYARHYDEAIDLMIKSKRSYDSVLSVQKIQNHMWSNESTPSNYNPWNTKHTLARDIEPVYFQTGGIFAQWSINMKKNHYFFGKKPKFVIHNQFESLDIDTEDDFKLAEVLLEFMDAKEAFR
ncbi:acylneuraminate cytidylyltransferase family protein [Gammaproteobacteria bacterium]|nr:acylneuraminate cytidylyltransferase family protein [Gammaproteobacteria bacterium]